MLTQTYRSCFPLFDTDDLEKKQITLLKHGLLLLGDFGQALFIRSCHENVILTTKSRNFTETAFVQGDSAGGSKLIEQTLPYWAIKRMGLTD